MVIQFNLIQIHFISKILKLIQLLYLIMKAPNNNNNDVYNACVIHSNIHNNIQYYLSSQIKHLNS